jgi:hypothetical protein
VVVQPFLSDAPQTFPQGPQQSPCQGVLVTSLQCTLFLMQGSTKCTLEVRQAVLIHHVHCVHMHATPFLPPNYLNARTSASSIAPTYNTVIVTIRPLCPYALPRAGQCPYLPP